jgi:putative hemolysin
MHALGRIPSPADHFEAVAWRFEVVDMDKNRVDKVLVSAVDIGKITGTPAASPAA